MMKNFSAKKFLLFTLVNIVVISLLVVILSERPSLVSVNSVGLESKNGDTLNVLVNVTLENPNFYSVSGKNVMLKSMSGEILLGEGRIEEFHLDGHSRSDVTVVLTLSADALKKSYTASKDDFQNTLTVSGSFWPLFFISEMNVGSQMSGKEMNKLMLQTFFAESDITFDSLNYVPVNAVESRMDFNVNLKNSFGFAFTVQSIELDVLPSEFSQTIIGNWKLTREVNMQPGVPIVLPGTLTVHHMGLMLAGLEKNGKDLDKAWVSGTVTVIADKEPIRLPFGFEVSSDMSKLNIGDKNKSK